MRIQLQKLFLVFVLLSVILVAMTPTLAQEETAAEGGPVVFGIFFFLPTCPHCHDVINNDMPVWEAEFGDSFVIIYADASTDAVPSLFFATCSAMGVSSRDCGSVPMMVIGDQVMIGSREIPERVPGLVRDGLAAGGIGVPDVEGLEAWVEETLGMPVEDVVATGTASASTGNVPTETENARSWQDKFKDDPRGNGLAVMTLIGLIGSVGAVLWLSNNGKLTTQSDTFFQATLAFLLAGTVVALSLAVKSADDTLATLMSWGAAALLMISIGAFAATKSPDQTLPLVTLAGLAAAVYLAQVEVSDVEATCGLVGDCNAVQQSAYARLFGVLPIGVLGIVGYVAILLVWGAARMWGEGAVNTVYAHAALFGMALFGVAFSIYLTFLEPFVIGATCAWCITSALVMGAVLWLVAPEGWQAVQTLRGGVEQPKLKTKR